MIPELGLYLDAFYDLDTERSLTDLQPIPWSSIMEYADRYGINEARLTFFIREADNAYLKKLHKRRRQ